MSVQEIIKGSKGAGKTYWAVEKRAIMHMGNGGLVLSNIKLKMPGVRKALKKLHKWDYQAGQYRYVNMKDINIEDLHSIIPPGTPDLPVMFILDETATNFDSGIRSKDMHPFTVFCRHNRHAHIWLVFIGQNSSMILKGIRDMTDYTYHLINMSTFRLAKLDLGWSLPQIRVLKFDNMQKDHLPGYMVMRKQIIYDCYDTHQFGKTLGLNYDSGTKTDFRSEEQKKKSKKKKGGLKMTIFKIAWNLVIFGIIISLLRYDSNRIKELDLKLKKLETNPPSKATSRSSSRKSTSDAPEKVEKSKKGDKLASLRIFRKFRVIHLYDHYKGAVLDNETYELGDYTPYGKVVGITKQGLEFRRDDGSPFFIFDRHPSPQKASFPGNSEGSSVRNSGKTFISSVLK